MQNTSVIGIKNTKVQGKNLKGEKKKLRNKYYKLHLLGLEALK